MYDTIKVSGFKDQIVEFEQPNAALVFLSELKQEHTDFINPLISHLNKPFPFYGPYCKPTSNQNDPAYPTNMYRAELRAITSKHPMKIEILEYDEDVSDLI